MVVRGGVYDKTPLEQRPEEWEGISFGGIIGKSLGLEGEK